MEGPISCNFHCTRLRSHWRGYWPGADSDRLVADIEERLGGDHRNAAGRLAEMPEQFRHRLRVRWSECDLQGVVFYPNYLAYFDHLLTELWREAVGPYGEITQLGIDLVVAEATIRYRASARFDDEIDVVAAITRLGTTSMTTELRIERADDRAILAEGELRHVFVDPDSFEKRGIPAGVRGGLSRFAVAA
jgi:acyl-CoA thioester hydrolase